MKKAKIAVVALGHYIYFQQFENLKEDVISLDELSKQQLVLECANRWRSFSEAPLPSRYRKYRAAYDLARAKGYEVSMNGMYTGALDKNNRDIQPEL